jgi:hypothetical protein
MRQPCPHSGGGIRTRDLRVMSWSTGVVRVLQRLARTIFVRLGSAHSCSNCTPICTPRPSRAGGPHSRDDMHASECKRNRLLIALSRTKACKALSHSVRTVTHSGVYPEPPPTGRTPAVRGQSAADTRCRSSNSDRSNSASVPADVYATGGGRYGMRQRGLLDAPWAAHGARAGRSGCGACALPGSQFRLRSCTWPR